MRARYFDIISNDQQDVSQIVYIQFLVIII